MSRSWAELLGEGAPDETAEESAGFFGRLRDSLSKSRRALAQQLTAFDASDDDAWERLEEALIGADLGVPATAELVGRLEAQGGPAALEEELASMLGEPATLNVQERPTVILDRRKGERQG